MPLPAIPMSEMTVELAVEHLVKIASEYHVKQANEFLDKLKNYGSQGLGALQSGLKSDNPLTAGAWGAGLGAAVGGVGGGIAGMMDRKKRSPWSTALSGALGGGAVGLGVAGGLSAFRGSGAAKPPAGLGDEAVANQKKLDTLPALGNKLTGDAGAKGDSVGGILGRGLRRNLIEDPRAGTENASASGLMAGAGAGTVGGVALDQYLQKGENQRATLAGLKGQIEKVDPAKVSADPVDPKNRAWTVHQQLEQKNRWQAPGYVKQELGASGVDQRELGLGRRLTDRPIPGVQSIDGSPAVETRPFDRSPAVGAKNDVLNLAKVHGQSPIPDRMGPDSAVTPGTPMTGGYRQPQGRVEQLELRNKLDAGDKLIGGARAAGRLTKDFKPRTLGNHAATIGAGTAAGTVGAIAWPHARDFLAGAFGPETPIPGR
jgi:hypothetical protein